MNKAVFFDKDGTMIRNVPYNTDPSKITLNEGIIGCLQQVSRRGYRILCVSNQGGVAKGYFREADLVTVNRKINSLLAAHDVYIDGFYYCPHDLSGTVQEYAVDC